MLVLGYTLKINPELSTKFSYRLSCVLNLIVYLKIVFSNLPPELVGLPLYIILRYY